VGLGAGFQASRLRLAPGCGLLEEDLLLTSYVLVLLDEISAKSMQLG
jgi:hypothetical protein